MSAKILHIKTKNRNIPNAVVKLEDFDYEEGEIIDPLTIVKHPNISLYCLDFKNQQAIFVETPTNIDLSQPPFYYLAQYEHAQKLIAVPLEELTQLVNNIEVVEQLIIIYSVGRCGSTLLSKVFNQVNTVLSLSEPDVFSQLVGLRNPDRSNDEEITGLLKACIYLLTKPNKQQQFSCCAIKMRGVVIELADLIYRVVPEAKSIFLYRNAEDVIKSSIRSFDFISQLLPTIKENIDFYNRFICLLKDYAEYIDFTDSMAIDLYAIGWLSKMQSYLALEKQNITTCALRYEDLVAEPQRIVSSLFQKCNLPIAEVSNACKAFAKDSQSGSNLSREHTNKNKLEQSNNLKIRKKIDNLLKKHAVIQKSGFILPGTLGCTS